MIFERITPVEDPARLRRFTKAIASLQWAPADRRASLEVLFTQLAELAQAEIEYYYGKRTSSRKFSKLCRFAAWLLGTAGILVPLVQPILGSTAPVNFLSWGYAAFGTAGTILLADTVFSGTRAHHRYTSTQLEVEHIYSAFALRWQRGLIEFDASPETDKITALVDETRAFCEAFHKALAAETGDWKKEVDEGLSQLKGKINAIESNK
jgi:hypothetical protein